MFRPRLPRSHDRRIATDRLQRIPGLGERERHDHHGHRVGERDPGDQEGDVGAGKLALLDDRESDRRRASGDDHRNQRRVTDTEGVVEQQADRHGGDGHDGESEQATREPLTYRR